MIKQTREELTGNFPTTCIWKIGKEILTEPGLEPETYGLPYQCSSIWAVQPLDGGSPKLSTSLCWSGAPARICNRCCHIKRLNLILPNFCCQSMRGKWLCNSQKYFVTESEITVFPNLNQELNIPQAHLHLNAWQNYDPTYHCWKDCWFGYP